MKKNKNDLLRVIASQEEIIAKQNETIVHLMNELKTIVHLYETILSAEELVDEAKGTKYKAKILTLVKD